MRNPGVIKITANNYKKPLFSKKQWLSKGDKSAKSDAVRFITGFILMLIGFLTGFLFPYNLIFLLGGAALMFFYGYSFAMRVWSKHGNISQS